MYIIYVHHGKRNKSKERRQDDDLTPLGYEDCELTARLLDDDKLKSKLKAIYTSQFFRCTKTAEIINKNLNLPIIIDSRLDESGSVAGESWVDVQSRVMQCIDDIVEKYNDDDIVICVTSGVNLCAFTNRAYNLPPSENAPYFGVPSCSPISFEYQKKR